MFVWSDDRWMTSIRAKNKVYFEPWMGVEKTFSFMANWNFYKFVLHIVL